MKRVLHSLVSITVAVSLLGNPLAAYGCESPSAPALAESRLILEHQALSPLDAFFPRGTRLNELPTWHVISWVVGALGAAWALRHLGVAPHAGFAAVPPSGVVKLVRDLGVAVREGFQELIDAFGDPLRKDRIAQITLRKMGLFQSSRTVKEKNAPDQQVTFRLFGFHDHSLETPRQVADVILNGENNLRKEGLLSNPESEELDKILQARENGGHEYLRFVRHIQQALHRNPYSIITRNAKNEVVGVVFCAFGNTDTAQDLPNLMIRQTHWHQTQRNKSRNTLVDFWFTGTTGAVAKATLEASFELATAARLSGLPHLTVEDEQVFAYSNIRTLWKYPNLTAEELVEKIKAGDVWDPAIGGHLKRGAEPVRVIHGAFPSILDRPGIGRGDAVVMRYSFKLQLEKYPWLAPPAVRPRPRRLRVPQRAALLMAA